jgi:hypothetical protein
MNASGPGGIIPELAKDYYAYSDNGELNKNSVKSLKERSLISGKFNPYIVQYLRYCPIFICLFPRIVHF